ncbi:MAG: hypothetical protein IJD88_04015, partial [Clostridia bacterium]|nr:hypothetical protein [Clostridia bacterium]
MSGVNKEYLKEHRLFRIRNKNILFLFPLVAVLITIIVFWCLKLVGITVTSDALCELEEHTHSAQCYSDSILTCSTPEHKHSSQCFPDQTADVETSKEWTASFENVTITNDVAKNLVSIASSQVGYKESLQNYKYDAYAVKHNYTRYGEWYGNPYGYWNATFVSFCLDYANINNCHTLESASVENMQSAWQEKHLYSPADDKYTCSGGDLVFFDTDSDNKADRVGIAIYHSDKYLIVIEGDVDGEVKNVIYENTDKVLGYGRTHELYYAKDLSKSDNQNNDAKTIEYTGTVNRYIPKGSDPGLTFKKFRSLEPQEFVFVPQSESDDNLLIETVSDYDDENHRITYTSHLENELVNVVIKDINGNVLTNGSTVYIGEDYSISLEFSEINWGEEWIQFRPNEDGYLTYL